MSCPIPKSSMHPFTCLVEHYIACRTFEWVKLRMRRKKTRGEYTHSGETRAVEILARLCVS